ncbi:flagellar basal-body MS-ring/collar protein FliF [Paracoccus ravus]|uniref:flagellar basal-body MS-ring/collar protein FliF n=1 Tax=Paracoccus ravus TaxID=2447760 RepID=UPI00106E2B6E|nr:flagellar basal-body MS-ring/collar protein FliF [Paracoccus ravus]
MKQFVANLGSLGTRRIAMLGGTAIGVIAALFLATLFLFKPEYRAVATDLTAADAAAMVATLESAGFKPEISQDNTIIRLPESDLARGRMALAEAGLPAAGNMGWEIFDNSSSIGMNSFLQRVNRLRALEGELARSIQTMDGVEAARVHLVLPERETFSQHRPLASASVMLRPRRGAQLHLRQAVAIRNLVSSAVPELAAENVVVLSSTGETILGDESDARQASLVSLRADWEQRIAKNVANILSAHVGPGNIRVEVAAEINDERATIIEERFDPEQQVARSISALEERRQGKDSETNGVDVANNLPGVDADAAGTPSREESQSKVLDETQFEIGSTRSERTVEPGGIKRLTVAVLVNGRSVDGSYVERSAEELERISRLVRSAAGIDDARGDIVTVDSLQFAEDADLLSGDTDRPGLLQTYGGTILRGVFLLAALALILFLGLRPLLRARDRGQLDETAALPREAVLELEGGGSPALEAAATPKTMIENSHVVLAPVSGLIERQSIMQLSQAVAENREESLRIIRGWIRQKG